MLSALNFILGCHPGVNTASFTSGVGSNSVTVAYGVNRADWSFIPGGVVTDASSRDTDEITIENVPLYFRTKGRGNSPGRNELQSVNHPVVIGGVLVCPGDVVVADGDGIIVVLRKVARQVAEYAGRF